MKLILLVILAGVILNPRIIFESESPSHLLSCSTGWSFYWEGLLREKGMLGIYSPESVAWAKVSNIKQAKRVMSDQQYLLKKEFSKACK